MVASKLVQRLTPESLRACPMFANLPLLAVGSEATSPGFPRRWICRTHLLFSGETG
jgi:hypothetical protein